MLRTNSIAASSDFPATASSPAACSSCCGDERPASRRPRNLHLASCRATAISRSTWREAMRSTI